jgi:glucose/arabinose dehydrogenase
VSLHFHGRFVVINTFFACIGGEPKSPSVRCEPLSPRSPSNPDGHLTTMHLGFSVVACALALARGAFAAPEPLEARQTPWKSTTITSHAEPWAIAFLPDNRVLVTERRGNLRLVNPETKTMGTITGVPAVAYGGQGGLHDVALHPNYAENSIIYLSCKLPKGVGKYPAVEVVAS